MEKDTRNGLILILLASLSFASFPTWIKFVYRYSDLHEFDLGFWQFTFAMPLMWAATSLWMRIGNVPKLDKPLPKIPLFMAGTLLAGAALTSFFGLRLIDAGVFVVLFFTYPAMVAIITTLMGKPLPLRGWIALILTLIGIVLVIPGGLSVLNFGSSVDTVFIQGVLLALLNGLLIAIYMIVNGRILRGYPSTARAGGWSITGAWIVMGAIVAIRGLSFPSSPIVWLLFLGLGLFGTVLPYFTLIIGTRLLGASRASIVNTMEPVFAIIVAWLLLGENLTPIQILGATLIIASVIILEAKFSTRKSMPMQVSTEAQSGD